MPNSTALHRKRRPKHPKPYPTFPLTAHPSGRWRKIHRGNAYYFGPLDDWEAALERYDREWPYIVSGRPIPADDADTNSDGFITIADVCNAYIDSKRQLLDNGELSPRTFADAIKTGQLILKAVDRNRDIETIGPGDFAAIRKVLARGRSLVVLNVLITRVRSVMKFAVESELREKAVRYGQSFTRPTRKRIRVERASRPEKFYTADACRTLIESAPVHLKAMILLALNAGLGNSDIGAITLKHIDLDAGIVSMPRPKTGAPRRAVLWPETIKALQSSLAERPDPTDEARDLVFITRSGKAWVRRTVVDTVGPGETMKSKLSQTDAVSGEFRKLLKITSLQADRRAFYSLRHTFRTIADPLADRPAVDLIMGHEDHRDMRSHYVASNRISDDRLRAVSDHIRDWIWSELGDDRADSVNPPTQKPYSD